MIYVQAITNLYERPLLTMNGGFILTIRSSSTTLVVILGSDAMHQSLIIITPSSAQRTVGPLHIGELYFIVCVSCFYIEFEHLNLRN